MVHAINLQYHPIKTQLKSLKEILKNLLKQNKYRQVTDSGEQHRLGKSKIRENKDGVAAAGWSRTSSSYGGDRAATMTEMK